VLRLDIEDQRDRASDPVHLLSIQRAEPPVAVMSALRRPSSQILAASSCVISS